MSTEEELLDEWTDWEDLVGEQDQLVRQHLEKRRGGFLDLTPIVRGLGKFDRTTPATLLRARAQKAYVLAIKARLDLEPGFAQKFVDKVGLAWLAKLVAATRLRELARVKIVKRGGSGGARYDISDLTATYYGRKILAGLDHDRRRRSLDASEFELLVKACAKIKLTLPETVEPTTTELFFDAPPGAAKKKKKSKTTASSQTATKEA